MNFTLNSFVSSFMLFPSVAAGRVNALTVGMRLHVGATQNNNLFKPVTLGTVHDFLEQT